MKNQNNFLQIINKEYDPKYPIICLDEKPKQFLADNQKKYSNETRKP
jgi:hypothetical protein